MSDAAIVEALRKQEGLVSKKPALDNSKVDLKVIVDVHKKLLNPSIKILSVV